MTVRGWFLYPGISQLGLEVGNAFGDEIIGDAALDSLREDLLGRRNGGFGGGGAHVGQCLSLACPILVSAILVRRATTRHARPGLDREPVGLGLGAGHDLRASRSAVCCLRRLFGQQRSGFLLQAAAPRRVGPDTDGALVERARDHV